VSRKKTFNSFIYLFTAVPQETHETIENQGFLTLQHAMGRSKRAKPPLVSKKADKIRGFEHAFYGMHCFFLTNSDRSCLSRTASNDSPRAKLPLRPDFL
jgi:hypothetical protein